MRVTWVIAGLVVSMATPANAESTGSTSEHEQVVQRWGATWFAPVTVGTFRGSSSTPRGAVGDYGITPVGVRRWFTNQWALDVGVGVAAVRASGDETTPSTAADGTKGTTRVSTDAPSVYGAALHLAMPWTLGVVGALTVYAAPELNVAYAQSKGLNSGLLQAEVESFRVDLGGQVGGEYQFGIVGAPNLSVRGSVGVNYGYGTTTYTDGASSARFGRNGVETPVGSSPWDFLRGNVAAIYYF